MATANFNLDAEDGWTVVTSGGAAFIRIRQNVKSHPFFVTSSGSAPAATVIGYKVECEDFWVDVETDEEYYVRVEGNVPQNYRIDVFTIPPAA
jgi:hypothetical protein